MRVRAAANERSRRSWIGRLNFLAKPLARLFVRLGHVFVSGPPSLLRSAATDALTTMTAFPLASVAIAALPIASLASDASSLFTSVMPIAFATCAIAIADIASREKRSGTSALVFAAPLLRTRFVWWKFTSSLLVAFAFLAVPLARAMALRPSSAIPLLIGLAFTCAAATALGVVSADPKTFVLTFLMFWYIAMNDKGASPTLDFAGWFGTATPVVMAAYTAPTAGFLVVAHTFRASELRRRW